MLILWIVCHNFRKFAQNNRISKMSRVTIKDKTFETSISEAEILESVKRVADKLNHDMEAEEPALYRRVEWLVHVCC